MSFVNFFCKTNDVIVMGDGKSYEDNESIMHTLSHFFNSKIAAEFKFMTAGKKSPKSSYGKNNLI